jgi:hypothetical protein
MAASALMGATGLAFALSGTYLVVVLAPLLGTLNPSSGSVSIFMSIEHAVLARATPGVDRPRRFARYGLIGAFAAAGALVTGSPDLRVGRHAALSSSYVMSVVTPRERPAAASITSLSRCLAAAASPVRAGVLFLAGFEAWHLVICSALKPSTPSRCCMPFASSRPRSSEMGAHSSWLRNPSARS